jgi:hypothetical protein
MSGADARQRRVGVGVGTAGGPATAPATAAPRAHQLHPHLAPPRQTGESWRARCRQETEHGSGPFEFRRNACRVACTVDSSPIAATEPSNTGSRGHALPAMPWHHRPEHRGVRSSAPRAPVTEDVSAESAPSTAPCRGSRSPAYQGRRPAASQQRLETPEDSRHRSQQPDRQVDLACTTRPPKASGRLADCTPSPGA